MGNTQRRFMGGLTGLCACLVLLVGHLVYLVLTDPAYFPINTVKIASTYQHISRPELEVILATHLNHGFYGFSRTALRTDLHALPWSDAVRVKRVWPDTVKITVVEKVPVARWNSRLMTASGDVFASVHDVEEAQVLPLLTGPEVQQQAVLQTYQAINTQLQPLGLHVAQLTLRPNQAWEATLSNGTVLRLGKEDVQLRIQRFCRAYPAVFSGKTDQLAYVDLRYAHGMAVQWRK